MKPSATCVLASVVSSTAPPVPRPFGRFVQLGGSSGNLGRFATRSDIVFLPVLAYTLSFA